MSNQDDPPLGRFAQGFLRAEAHEAQEGTDAPLPEADQRLAAAMRARFAPQSKRTLAARRVIAIGLAAAAAAGLVVLGQRLLAPSQLEVAYALTVKPSSAVLGTSPPTAGPKPVARDGMLEIELRPEHATRVAKNVKAFVHTDAGYQEWPVGFERFPSGTFKLQRRVAELPPLPAGNFEFVVVLCPRDLPDNELLMRQLQSAAVRLDQGCQHLTETLVLTGP